MNSIEFGKKCRPYNIQYRTIFGYVPCREDYRCSQDVYFDALLQSIKTKRELATIIPNSPYQLTNYSFYIHPLKTCFIAIPRELCYD